MSYFALYLVERFLYRTVDFFHHWYIDASITFLHSFFSVLARLDETFAVHVTARHFFEPLYRDYSMVGRILGIIFRSARILIGSAIYFVLMLVFLATYVVWMLIPILIIFFIFRHFASNPNNRLLPY